MQMRTWSTIVGARKQSIALWIEIAIIMRQPLLLLGLEQFWRKRKQMTPEELQLLVESNAKAIQAMLDQRASDRLLQEERARDHQERMRSLEDLTARLVRIEEAQNRILSNLDDDRPTILRKLNKIEQKLDRLLGTED
jgi:hypothetical protein